MLNLSELRDSLPDNFLLFALIALVVAGNVLFVVTSVLPGWQAYEQVSVRIAADEAALEARAAEQDLAEMVSVLQAQVDTAQVRRDDAARMLLTPAQADSFVERLYHYAASRGIEIVNLQAQQTPQTVENGIYEVRAFRLQAVGRVGELVKAIAAMQEIALPSIVLDEIVIESGVPEGSLTMTLMIYSSPFTANNLLDLLPDSPVPAIEQQRPLTAPVVPVPLNPVMVVEATPVPIECPGARATLFRAGDRAVVDFNGIGALRILEAPSGFDTLTQVYDGAVLHLLEGPVCGTWREENILYWLVEQGGVQGWAGEGDSEDRWMCPLADPDCADS